jgi:regulator of sigma E protease
VLTLFSFVVALCVLIAVHESGHYLMARACGVGVLKFSIGSRSWEENSPATGKKKH